MDDRISHISSCFAKDTDSLPKIKGTLCEEDANYNKDIIHMAHPTNRQDEEDKILKEQIDVQNITAYYYYYFKTKID